MTLYVCMYPACSFRVVHVRGPPVDPAMSLPSSDAMHPLASAALANAESVEMLTAVLAAVPPPIVREELGETSSGHRVTLLQQQGRPAKMKVGSGNRGGAKVRARQEAPLDFIHSYFNRLELYILIYKTSRDSSASRMLVNVVVRN